MQCSDIQNSLETLSLNNKATKQKTMNSIAAAIMEAISSGDVEVAECNCKSETCVVNAGIAFRQCPATKTEKRAFTLELDLDELCREHQIDAATIDKRVFPATIIVDGEIERQNAALAMSLKTTVAKSTTFALGQQCQRIDTVENNVTVAGYNKYELMAAEDAAAHVFSKQCLVALLRSSSARFELLDRISIIFVSQIYTSGTICSAKQKGTKTLRVARKTVDDAVSALLAECSFYATYQTQGTAQLAADKAKWAKFATAFVSADKKKKADKKAKEEAETKERLAAEAAQRAEEAAALKIKLGNPTLVEQKLSEQI